MLIAVRLAAGLFFLVLALISIVTCMLTCYAPARDRRAARRSRR